MKNFFIILAIVILQTSCHNSDILDDKQEKQVYSLINEFIIDSLYHPDLISLQTMKFYNGSIKDSLFSEYEYFYFNNTFFDTILKAKLIDSNDLKLIKLQYAQTKKLIWNSSKLSTRTFDLESIDKKIRQHEIKRPYEYLKQKYNARSFIKLSIPLFTKGNKLIIMSIAFRCGSSCGEGADYVFKKINNKWTIVYKESLWIS